MREMLQSRDEINVSLKTWFFFVSSLVRGSVGMESVDLPRGQGWVRRVGTPFQVGGTLPFACSGGVFGFGGFPQKVGVLLLFLSCWFFLSG